MLPGGMCSSYSVKIYRGISKKVYKVHSLKSSSKKQLGWPLFPGTVHGSQGPQFHPQQQNSLVNTYSGKHALKRPSQSSAILELLM